MKQCWCKDGVIILSLITADTAFDLLYGAALACIGPLDTYFFIFYFLSVKLCCTSDVSLCCVLMMGSQLMAWGLLFCDLQDNQESQYRSLFSNRAAHSSTHVHENPYMCFMSDYHKPPCLRCVLKGNFTDFYAHNVFLCLLERCSEEKMWSFVVPESLKTAWSHGWDLQVWKCVCVEVSSWDLCVLLLTSNQG